MKVYKYEVINFNITDYPIAQEQHVNSILEHILNIQKFTIWDSIFL